MSIENRMFDRRGLCPLLAVAQHNSPSSMYHMYHSCRAWSPWQHTTLGGIRYFNVVYDIRMTPQCGVLVWCVGVVCRCGVPVWCVGVVCRCGVLVWCAGVVCRCVVPGWCASVMCRGGVPV